MCCCVPSTFKWENGYSHLWEYGYGYFVPVFSLHARYLKSSCLLIRLKVSEWRKCAQKMIHRGFHPRLNRIQIARYQILRLIPNWIRFWEKLWGGQCSLHWEWTVVDGNKVATKFSSFFYKEVEFFSPPLNVDLPMGLALANGVLENVMQRVEKFLCIWICFFSKLLDYLPLG